MSDDRVLYEVDADHRIATITFNNPKQRNSYDAAMRDEVAKIATTAEGGRNEAIFVGDLKLGSYVAGAGLDEPVVIAALEGAAETNGYTAEHGVMSTRATIRDWD